MIVTAEDARRFAVWWAEAWNNRDMESVLAYFDQEVVFTSPTALAVVGVPTVHGKEELRAYWMAALNRIKSLHFKLDRILWDPERRELAIIYTSEVDGTTKRVSENLTFDQAGRIVTAEVFHGVGRAKGSSLQLTIL
jgi:limonene-1,2-epoxide hydrolase